MLSFILSAIIAGQACTVKTVCVAPHKPAVIKPLVLDQMLYMCLYLEPLIITLPADTVPMALNIPESPGLPDETFDAPVVADVVPSQGFWLPNLHGSAGAPPRLAMIAPELDGNSTGSALTLLAGGLWIVVRKGKRL